MLGLRRGERGDGIDGGGCGGGRTFLLGFLVWFGLVVRLW